MQATAQFTQIFGMLLLSLASQVYWQNWKRSDALTLTMATHLMMESPRPESAPQRPATVLDKHRDNRNPSQLNRNETEIIIQVWQ